MKQFDSFHIPAIWHKTGVINIGKFWKGATILLKVFQSRIADLDVLCYLYLHFANESMSQTSISTLMR